MASYLRSLSPSSPGVNASNNGLLGRLGDAMPSTSFKLPKLSKLSARRGGATSSEPHVNETTASSSTPKSIAPPTTTATSSAPSLDAPSAQSNTAPSLSPTPPRERNVIIAVPAAYQQSDATPLPPLPSSNHPLSSSYSITSPVPQPPVESFINSANRARHNALSVVTNTRDYVVSSVRADPMVASLVALAGYIVSYVNDMRINARVVMEDPAPNFKRAMRLMLDKILTLLKRAAQSRTALLYCLCVLIVIQLAKLGIFASPATSRHTSITSNMEPIPMSPTSPAGPSSTAAVTAHDLHRSVLVGGGSSRNLIVSPMISTDKADGAVATPPSTPRQNRDGSALPTSSLPLHPLSDGTLAHVASRFLALFTNSPAPSRRGLELSPEDARARALGEAKDEEVVVVNNGPYVETYEVKLTSNSSPILEDPDRFVSNLIANHVKEEEVKERMSRSSSMVNSANAAPF